MIIVINRIKFTLLKWLLHDLCKGKCENCSLHIKKDIWCHMFYVEFNAKKIWGIKK